MSIPGRSHAECVILTVAATLPLQGWFQPSRFIPVRLAPGETSLVGEGVVPVDAATSSTERVVPLLVEQAQPILRCGTTTLPLHAVGPGEKLVASTGDAVRTGGRLFPAAQVDPVPLQPGELLTGPAAAWTALDALVLDTAEMRRIDDTTRSTLLASGVTLAAVGLLPPDAAWPWQREAGLWTLRHTVAGPVALVDAGAYAPLEGWTPRPTLAVRRRVVLAGVLLLIAVAAAMTLTPPRWGLIAVATLALLGSGVVLAWRASLGSVDQAGGDLLVADGDGLLQRDIWLYQRARDRTRVTLPWAGDTEPVFETAAALERSDVRIHVDAAGGLSYTASLASAETVTFRRRTLGQPPQGPAVPDAGHSPLQELARVAYLQHGRQIRGEWPGLAGRWNSVLVTR